MLKSVIYMHRFQLNDATEAGPKCSRTDQRSEIPDPRSEIPSRRTQNRTASRPKYDPDSPLEWRVQVEPGAKMAEKGGAEREVAGVHCQKNLIYLK